VPRLPERLARLDLVCQPPDSGWLLFNRSQTWRDLDAALFAAAPRLRSSLRMTFGTPEGRRRDAPEGIVPPSADDDSPAEETAALLTLLTRHAAQIEHIELDLSHGDLRRRDGLAAYLQEAAARGLLRPSNPFLPALRTLRVYAPSLAPGVLSGVPAFAEHLENVYLATDGTQGHEDEDDETLRLHGDALAGLRRLRALSRPLSL
jgi:hypothetical protein